MKKRVLIIVLFQNLGADHPYYARNPAPPLPGLLLAGMTPPIVEVEVLHEMVRPIEFETDADLVAVSFMDYLAPHAYRVAAAFRARGKTVVGGGKFVSTFPEEAAPHFDSILVGEAQGVWPQMVRDYVDGRLKKRYDAEPVPSLAELPPPRYDLAESVFRVPVVTEATRGCPHPCTFCQLNIRRLPYRTRPVEDVIRDLKATERLPWWKRKMAMILDNNLGGDLAYAKQLLREIAKLKFWAVGVQFSIECLRDQEFVELLAAARCRMAFIGMESLNGKSLAGVKKRQNAVEEYRASFERLHRKGILTFTGYMFGLDEDTRDYYRDLAQRLDETGPMVILSSIAIPLYGTPLYHTVRAEGRMTDEDLSHYDGDHLVFRHKHLDPEEIMGAYREVNRVFFSWKNIMRRWMRFLRLQKIDLSVKESILKLAVTPAIYFQLSYFQRHHAQVRVLPGYQAPGSRAGREAVRQKGGPSLVSWLPEASIGEPDPRSSSG